MRFQKPKKLFVKVRRLAKEKKSTWHPQSSVFNGPSPPPSLSPLSFAVSGNFGEKFEDDETGTAERKRESRKRKRRRRSLDEVSLPSGKK